MRQLRQIGAQTHRYLILTRPSRRHRQLIGADRPHAWHHLVKEILAHILHLARQLVPRRDNQLGNDIGLDMSRIDRHLKGRIARLAVIVGLSHDTLKSRLLHGDRIPRGSDLLLPSHDITSLLIALML